MVFKNHIAYRFLTDINLTMEMCETTHPDEWKELLKRSKDSRKEDLERMELNPSPGLETFLHLISYNHNKTFYVSETVLEKLDFLKINKTGPHFNWMVFKGLSDQKITLIMPDQKVLRIWIHKETVNLFWLTFQKDKNSGHNLEGNMHWVMNYVHTDTGELCPHFDHPDSLEIEEFMYKLMCFFYLTDNDEMIIPAGKTHGTRKTGKVLNDFKFPVTMVNSRWNTATIRTEQFGVRGHFRIQPCGKARSEYELIFIEPFIKHGYKRQAGKTGHIEN